MKRSSSKKKNEEQREQLKATLTLTYAKCSQKRPCKKRMQKCRQRRQMLPIYTHTHTLTNTDTCMGRIEIEQLLVFLFIILFLLFCFCTVGGNFFQFILKRLEFFGLGPVCRSKGKTSFHLRVVNLIERSKSTPVCSAVF